MANQDFKIRKEVVLICQIPGDSVCHLDKSRGLALPLMIADNVLLFFLKVCLGCGWKYSVEYISDRYATVTISEMQTYALK